MPFLDLIPILTEPSAVLAEAFASSAKCFATPPTSSVIVAPADTNPAEMASVPETVIVSAPPLAKFNLIEALVISSGWLAPAVAGWPVGVDALLLGLLPAAISK